jgi:hypothetical protein
MRRATICWAAILVAATVHGLAWPAGAQTPPVGVVAAGDSLRFLQPGRQGSPYLQPSVPLQGEVRDLALLVDPFAKGGWRALVGVATTRGLVLWGSEAKVVRHVPLGRVEALEQQGALWAALVGPGDGEASEASARRVLVARGSHLESLADPQLWQEVAQVSPEASGLALQRVKARWLQEMAPGQRAWKELDPERLVPALLVTHRSGREVEIVSLDPVAQDAVVLPEGETEGPGASLAIPFAFPTPNLTLLLERGAQGNPGLRLLGRNMGGALFWRASRSLDPLLSTWIERGPRRVQIVLAGPDSLALWQVFLGGPRTAELRVEEQGGRSLGSRPTALAHFGRDWLAVACQEASGETRIEVFQPFPPLVAPVATCRIPGTVGALGLVPWTAIY